jgi:hypothetical protein
VERSRESNERTIFFLTVMFDITLCFIHFAKNIPTHSKNHKILFPLSRVSFFPTLCHRGLYYGGRLINHQELQSQGAKAGKKSEDL